jgi:hypothetical protein
VTLVPGAHALTVEVSDGKAAASCNTSIAVTADTSPPTITSCPGNQSPAATNPTGALVSYPPAEASDSCGVPAILYSQNSGSLFPIGNTTVTVVAADAANNQATCAFVVHVKGAGEQTRDLIAYVCSLPVHDWTKLSLLGSLEMATISLGLHKPQPQIACEALRDFVSMVSAQKGKKLTGAQATQLIQKATQIQRVIGCR